jgi:hypothetical protein
VVTGTLSFNGKASVNGLVLVIGQGIVSESGGGNGGFNGTIFVAKTRNATAPYSELATLGLPLTVETAEATATSLLREYWKWPALQRDCHAP